MDSVDLEVLRKSAQWLNEGKRVLLVTVVRTWGSSPRPPGAMLAVRDDGQVVGSVSGGCIEDDIVERSRREGPYITRPQAATYGVTAEDARKFGLPCGGTIQLVLEPAGAHSGIAELLGMIEQGKLVARKLDLESAKVTLTTAHATDGLLFDGKTLTTIHGPRYRMLVIGAGQLSKYLAQIAVGLDYQVTRILCTEFRGLLILLGSSQILARRPIDQVHGSGCTDVGVTEWTDYVGNPGETESESRQVDFLDVFAHAAIDRGQESAQRADAFDPSQTIVGFGLQSAQVILHAKLNRFVKRELPGRGERLCLESQKTSQDYTNKKFAHSNPFRKQARKRFKSLKTNLAPNRRSQ